MCDFSIHPFKMMTFNWLSISLYVGRHDISLLLAISSNKSSISWLGPFRSAANYYTHTLTHTAARSIILYDTKHVLCEWGYIATPRLFIDRCIYICISTRYISVCAYTGQCLEWNISSFIESNVFFFSIRPPKNYLFGIYNKSSLDH
jgi:hypothetical protein